jgi:zinc transport system permease protein
MPDLLDALQFGFMQRALLAGALVALACAVVGTFVVLRGMSLLGDSLAHASFGGVALGVLLGIAPFYLALVVAVIGGIVIHTLEHRRVLRGDTALGIVFATGLGVGVIVVSAAGGFNVNLLSFLFGSILAVTWADVILYAVLAGAIVGMIVALYKEYLFLTFDAETAGASGLPIHALDILFTTLTAVAVVVSIKIVGVLLVSALLVLPAATSQHVGRSFRQSLLLAVVLAMVSTSTGILLSFLTNWPPGGSIVMVGLALFIATLLGRAAWRWISVAPAS